MPKKCETFFSQVLGILAEPVEQARAHSITYSILFLVVGCIVGLAMFLQVQIPSHVHVT
jgi:hypothetical protein